MIAPKEDSRWTALLKGQLQHQFQFTSAAMMVSRCQRQVSGDPSSQAKSLDELHAFFTKFENIVSEDLKAIFH
jgi:hypothetical protein